MTNTNFLLITVDDMNYNSKEFLLDKEKVPQLMPNLDALRAEGAYFENSHVAIGLCQPSRSTIMTGKYPHCNGARGFEDISPDVKTLTGILHNRGYYNGIMGKENHISPREQFCWDMYERTENLKRGYGRDPEVYYNLTKEFLNDAEDNGKPFFLMVNSHDPHRPFANSAEEIKFYGKNLPCDELFAPEDIKVPDFLPDLPDVKKELSEYLNSVHRGDKTVGKVLQALEEAGQADNTFIFFLSDNGMSIPFCKANCYLNSTKSPFIVKWKGHIKENTYSDALVSTIDFMPTILDIVGEDLPENIDGTSFLDVLCGRQKEQSETIYTMFYKTANNPTTKCERWYPMRCVQDKRFAYIYNDWADKELEYRTETMAGLSFSAMQEAAKDDPEVAKRVDFYLHRVKEEYYDYRADPGALNNLANDPDHQEAIQAMRDRMKDYMSISNDELLLEYSKLF